MAISNHRLLSLTDTEVRFRYKDYAHGNRRKIMTLAVDEFIRRFLLHVLPTGFMRIRHYGLLANRTKRAQLAQARESLQCAPPDPALRAPETVPAFWLRVAQRDITLCPHCCAGHLHIIGSLPRMRPPSAGTTSDIVNSTRRLSPTTLGIPPIAAPPRPPCKSQTAAL